MSLPSFIAIEVNIVPSERRAHSQKSIAHITGGGVLHCAQIHLLPLASTLPCLVRPLLDRRIGLCRHGGWRQHSQKGPSNHIGLVVNCNQ